MCNANTEGVNLIILVILGLNSDICNQNNLVYIKQYNTLEGSSVKYVVKNDSKYAVSARLKISLDGTNYYFDGEEVIIDPGLIGILKPKFFTKHTRLVYKYVNSPQNINLDNVLYLPQM